MSPTIIAVIVMVLTNVLTQAGINVGSEQLTTTIDVLVTVVGGIVIWVRHLSLKKQVAGTTHVNVLGGVKKAE